MTKSNRKKLIVISIAGLAAALAAAVWIKTRRSPHIPAISSAGGAIFEQKAPENAAHFLQNDPTWGSDKIGGSGEPLASVGCTICAVAMAADQLGYPINPQQLNERLIQNEGFTERGWLIWGKVKTSTENQIDIHVPSGMTHADIDAALQGGSVPVVRYTMASGYPHWVPIVGKSGKEYLIKDPLDTARQIAPLSSKTDVILSVRYVEKS